MEAEVFKRLKSEPSEALQARLIRDRAKGRCEFEWYDDFEKHRCRELHNEPALDFKGRVQLCLMPLSGLGDGRIVNLKCLCQKHAYEVLERMASSINYKKKQLLKPNKDQTDLFGMG